MSDTLFRLMIQRYGAKFLGMSIFRISDTYALLQVFFNGFSVKNRLYMKKY